MWKYVNGDTLAHHGILGMKWGVRRYQNKDGTLTPEGRKRYGDGDANTDSDSGNESVDTKKTRVLKSRSAAELYKHADLFSDAELKQAYDRLSLEANIKKLSPAKVNKGEQYVAKLLKTSASVTKLIDDATKTYANIDKVMKLAKNMPVDDDKNKK